MSIISYQNGRFPIGGYRYDMENVSQLRATSTDVSKLLAKRIDTGDEFNPKPLFKSVEDPRRDLQVENQGGQGACAGHAWSSCKEFIHWISTGRMEQFSRAYGYYAAQREDGINGDQGSTINGCAKVARTRGIPLEKDWEYPSHYDPNPPGGWEKMYKRAAEYKVGSHTFLTSGAEDVQYLRAGVGAIQIGIDWGGDVDRNGEFRWSPQGKGGHSVMLCGWKLINGDWFVWLLNSWGKDWGDDGWALVNIRTLDRMHQHPHTVFVGYSDENSPVNPRKLIDFSKRPIMAA